jgi:hypothetical protein
MKKKTPTEKYIDQAVKQAIEANPQGTSIVGNTIIGVKFDAKAVEAINLIAKGLIANAEGLGDLAKVLRASNVEVDAMIKISGPAPGGE